MLNHWELEELAADRMKEFARMRRFAERQDAREADSPTLGKRNSDASPVRRRSREWLDKIGLGRFFRQS